jgi:hypothetical protein
MAKSTPAVPATSEIGQGVRRREKKGSQPMAHGYLRVLQRWQIYTNIALPQG